MWVRTVAGARLWRRRSHAFKIRSLSSYLPNTKGKQLGEAYLGYSFNTEMNLESPYSSHVCCVEISDSNSDL